MEIKQDLTAVNFTKSGLKEVRAIILHSMWGTHQGSISWFRNKDSQASAHYLISAEGEIRQMVSDKDMAWHAGIYDEPIPDYLRPNPNFYSIGIELEDKRDPNWSYPQPQREATSWLVDMLLRKYGLSKDRVILHKELNPSRRSDPVGQFSRDWLFATPSQDTSTTEEKRGLQVLNEYRAIRTTPNGPEGNFEGYARSITGNDARIPSLLAEIENLKESLDKSKLELTNSLTLAEDNLATINKNWQIKLDLLNEQLKNAPSYVLNLSSTSDLLIAFINKITGKSKTKEQLDAELIQKGINNG